MRFLRRRSTDDCAVTKLFDDGAEDSAYLPGWLHALETCVHAVRTRGLASDFDSSEVLEMKLLEGKSEEARALGKRAVARNPGLAYAYYIMARGTSAEEGLRAAKDGLRCGGASQFTRSQLLWIAVEAAARTALTTRLIRQFAFRRGVTLLLCVEDSQTFLDETPRDHPSIDYILTWKLLLSTRREFERIAGLIAELGYKTADRQLLDTQEYICQEYDRGLQEWEHLLEGLRNPDGEGEGTPVCGSAEADDFAWLEELVSGSGRPIDDGDDAASHVLPHERVMHVVGGTYWGTTCPLHAADLVTAIRSIREKLAAGSADVPFAKVISSNVGLARPASSHVP
ncbi:hypothetical protein LXA43DRAFT_1096257 [Ganoderma leucocontextum]|nr:hypothetical protein LXA43DRAFT_1096257 [Ganoderma leucocontextum]